MALLFQAAYKNPLTATIIIIAPVFMFSHIYFLYHPSINKGGIFGYKFWSVFFDSLMWPLFAFAMGYLIQKIKHHYITDKKGCMYANIVSVKAFCISFYYLAITIYPYRGSLAHRLDLDHSTYYIIAVVTGILVGLIIVKTPRRLKNSLKAIHYMFSVLYDGLEERALINPWKKKEFDKYKVEVTNKVVDYEEGL